MSKTLYIVVPCYNEQEVLPETAKRLLEKLQSLVLKNKIADNSRIMFVNDGSKDQTWSMIKGLCEENSVFAGVNLSRNRGHQNALLAGMATAVKYADMIVTMDADLQDPPMLLPEMLRIIREEQYDSVATRRVTRKGEPPIRSFCARQFYHIMNKISDVELMDGARDYRFMTRKYVNAVLSLKEFNRFSKGIFGWVGFRTKWLEFENQERSAGETKWSFWKLVQYSLQGIVSFSETPLYMASVLGGGMCGVALLACIVILIGGIQLLSIGILGLYFSKMYLEIKHRPIYIMSETCIDLERKEKTDEIM